MRPLIFAIDGWEGFPRRLRRLLPADAGRVEVRSFPDGETYLRVRSPCRGRKVAIIANLSRPDSKVLKLVFLAESLRAQGARSIGLLAPYLPYMRQDRSFRRGEAITSKIFAKLISESFDWLLTVDPHLHRYSSLSEIYSIPCRVVTSAPTIARWIRNRVRTPVVFGPDEESTQWVSRIAEEIDAPFFTLHKKRRGDRQVTVSGAGLRRWKGLTPILMDDIISTGSTMIEGVRRVRRAGFQRPLCIGVHGVFSDRAYQALLDSGAGEVVTTNTIPHGTNKVDLTGLLVEATRSMLGQF